jgi:protein-S-isoprenylcysteine O-methyltransferase Ste14
MTPAAADPRARALPLTRKLILLDIGERLIVAAVFASFVYRMLSHAGGSASVIMLLLVLAETLPFVYMMLRAPSATLSVQPVDWALAVMGTIMPLCVTPVAAMPPLLPLPVCLGAMLAGLYLQVAAKLILGRRFGLVAANRGVRVFGPYRFIRHPMYAGYTLTQIGFLLAMPSALNAVLYALALAFQVARIHREERILRLDPAYCEFAEQVRYRLLPGVF